MTGWIIYFKEASTYNKSYIDLYREEGKKLGIQMELVLVEELDFGVGSEELTIRYQGKVAKLPDFVVARAIYPMLTRQFELMGIRVFNNSKVAEICNDKSSTYQYLAGKGIQMVPSYFYKNQQVMDIVMEGKSGQVLKAVEGHGGSQVFLTGTKEHNTSTIIKGLGSSDIVCQPLVKGKGQDLRVYVLGDQILASVLRTAKDGFKSNFSLGGSVAMYTLSEKEEGIVRAIMKEFSFDLVGIDFILDEDGELIFNEIEDVVGARMLYQCSDINIVEQYMAYIQKEMLKEDNNQG